MKKLFPLILLLTTTVLVFNFTLPEEEEQILEIYGEWNLIIDDKIDGNISGSNGCEIIKFTSKGKNTFVGEYAKCSQSNVAKPSQFSGTFHQTNRGNLINLLQDNNATTQYYAAWSGKLMENGAIVGIWTDVVGNQGEFKLVR